MSGPKKTIASTIDKVINNVKAAFNFVGNADDILEAVVGPKEEDEEEEEDE
jgi:hypothetical protein